ncbi:LysR family transcriptional regulator [Frateuria hangzhouensis]|uniref:LysR family transcriptional regulator n=1 Tax=Frateuria hangzhouensis TaxID=2995589 RepID=UPI0022608E16|nr:LysR family transcriptional regulator [Frateuria sp. STR12]MCX7513070.1 LysR family transcriptional regulator [Frateuria sp. STR12]
MDRLAAMEAFVRVVDAGSFSGAARLLRVGQPAVSKTVAQLEERLGVRLLLRSTHGLTPTEAGRSFYERARRAIEEADEAEHAARGAGATLTGRLRICAAVTFSRLHVLPRLPLFLEQHPQLDVDFVLDDRNIDLIEEGIDIALRMGKLADSNLIARKIGQSPRRVFASPAYLERMGVPHVPADLAGHQAVIYEQRGGGTEWSFRRDGTTASVAMQGRVRVTAAEGVREAVFAGLGLAVASEWMFAPELASGAVQSVLDDWNLPPVDLWAVFPTGRQASAKARAFAGFIEAQLSDSA